MASAALLLHPVRLRIVQAFLGDRALTTGQLARELTDVPTPSLYRQVARLAEAGVLHIVDEQPVRGAVERTYMLSVSASRVNPEDLRAMSAEDHVHSFTAFVAALLAAFDRYVAAADPDLERDRVTYRMAAAQLSDEEYAELMAELMAVIAPRLSNAPSPERRRRLVAWVSVPTPEA